MLTMDFIASLSLDMQDDLLAVRSLLQVRCENNDVIFNQYLNAVGSEPAVGGGQQILISNCTSVSANPTSSATSNPRLQAIAGAWAKVVIQILGDLQA